MAKYFSQTAVFIVSVALLVLFCVVWHVLFSQSGPVGPRIPIAVQHYNLEQDGDAPQCVLERKAPELLTVFPEPDDWRRDANLIRFPEASLYFLFKGEPNLSDNGRQMSLNKCSAVYLPRARRINPDESQSSRPSDEKADAASSTQEAERQFESLESRAKRALVFEVSDQIILNFSVSLLDYDRLRKENLNLSLLEGGNLNGQVVVRGGDETDEHNPAFYVQTRDVAFNARQFRTAADVSFRFGPHSGTGEGLTIDYETPETFERRAKKNDARESESEHVREPVDQEELESIERARVMAQIDEIVEDGNLGVGCSIRRIEINKLKDYIHLDLTALGDAFGESESTKLDRLDVGCRGGLHFEPTSHEPGQWCVRFDDNVTAIAWRQSERVCVFKGQAFSLYFQDPLIKELQMKSTDAFRALNSRRPSGALARLKATQVLVEGDEEPITAEYTQISADEGAPPRVFTFTAMQAYYDDNLGSFKLFNRLKTDASDVGTPAPVSVSVVEYDRDTGEPVTSTLTSPTIHVNFDKETGLKLLETKGNGSLRSHMRTNKNERVEIQAFWESGLQLEPVEEKIKGAYLLTSSGASRCVVENLGAFYATELNFWFRVAEKFSPRAAFSKNGRADAAAEKGDASGKFDVGFAPICAKFAKDVVMETARGKITVGDSVVVRFSDQNAAVSTAPTEAEGRKTFANAEPTGNLNLHGPATPESDGYFTLNCDRLDVSCELVPREATGAESQGGKRVGLRVVRGTTRGSVSFVDRDANNNERASLYADMIVAENPLTDAMKLYLSSENDGARFHANELTFRGRNVEIDVAQNAFQANGAGSVTILPSQEKRGGAGTAASTSGGAKNATFDLASAGSLADPISITWTKAMVFDGQRMRFLANDADDVVVQTTDASIRCAETRVALKRGVNLQNLKFNDDSMSGVDYVECLGAGLERPARMNFASRSTTSEPAANAGAYNGYYEATCDGVRVAADTGVFTIESQGELKATILSDKGVAGLSEAAQGAALNSGTENAATSVSGTNGASQGEHKQWIRVSARFNGATGSINNGSAEINGGVNALVCDVDSPASPVTLGDPTNVPKGALTFYCRRAMYRSAGGGKGMKEDVELEAQGDVTFRMDDISGYCESLGYAASKNLVTLAGAENSPATLERQAYSGAPRTKIAEFMNGKIRLDTRKFEVENLTYSDSLDNLGGKLFKEKDGEKK